MKAGKENRLIQCLIVSPVVLTLSGCNISIDLDVPSAPGYYGILEASTPELTVMLQQEVLDILNLPFLQSSTVIYYQDPIFDLVGPDNRVSVNTSTGEFTVVQTFSVDSGSNPKALVDSAGIYTYEGSSGIPGGPMTCDLGIKMMGTWTEADQTLTDIKAEVSTVRCEGGGGAPFRSTNINNGNAVAFLDDAMDLNRDGAGGYIDGVIRYKFALLDVTVSDIVDPIAFEFEATTMISP